MLDAAAGRRPAPLRGAVQGAAEREHDPRDRQLPVPAQPGAREIRERIDDDQQVAAPRSTTTPAATSRSKPQPTPTTPRSATSSRDLRACTEGTLTGRTTKQYSEAKFLQVSASSSASGPRGLDRARPAMDREGHRRAQLVRVLRHPSASARTHASTSTTRTRAEVGRTEGEARLHRARRQPRLPVRAGVGRARRVRSASWSSTRRSDVARTIGALRSRAVREARPAAAGRDAAAEDPRHRAVCGATSASCTTRTGSDSRLRNLTIEEYHAEQAYLAAAAPMTQTGWTTPSDVRSWLARGWDRGWLLASVVEPGTDSRFECRSTVPDEPDLGDRFDEARAWVAAIEGLAAPRTRRGPAVNHRQLGAQDVPAQVWIDTVDDAAVLIGKSRDLHAFVNSSRRRPSLSRVPSRSSPSGRLKCCTPTDDWADPARVRPTGCSIVRSPASTSARSTSPASTRSSSRSTASCSPPYSSTCFRRMRSTPRLAQRHRAAVWLSAETARRAVPHARPATAADVVRFRRSLPTDRGRLRRIPPPGRVLITENEINFLALPTRPERNRRVRGRFGTGASRRRTLARGMPRVLLGRHRHSRLLDPRPAPRGGSPRGVAAHGSTHADGPS